MQTISPRHAAIARYYDELNTYLDHEVMHEGATRSAFQNLLQSIAPQVTWHLVPELPLANGKRPDGTLRDNFNLPRGYWEAKDTDDDLQIEIRKKIAAGYPINNIIFEDTHHAVLYQSGKLQMEIDLRLPRGLADLLTAFFNHSEAVIESFEQAVSEFRERVPELAMGLKERIRQEHEAHNPAFRDAWATFYQVCKDAIDPNIRSETVDEMLVQHLLTERLFRTVFNNPDFVRRNAIAVEIEKVIDALTIRAFDRREFLRSLDRFYVAIEQAAQGLEDWSQKQAFMNTIYERFFQGFSVKEADTRGIVYTPQEIVDFMCASVEEVLRREFGCSLADQGVQVLDPATGTGSYIVNLLRRIPGTAIECKYQNDLFANEVMLLPYYIASLNIEHTYYERTGRYLPFEGICFADTLDLAERAAHQGMGERSLWVSEKNTERVERERDAKIMVVIGNPPYNVGQENENDNNKNRSYDVIDARIKETYAKDSTAKLKTKNYDTYVKFLRWAIDRLQDRDGIVCLVTNNSFVHKDSLDGVRKHLCQDFTHIWHLDLGGGVNEGGGGNVFSITLRVGITLFVRHRDDSDVQPSVARIYYSSVPNKLSGAVKLAMLEQLGNYSNVDWQEVTPDSEQNWLTEGLAPEFRSSRFLPLVTRQENSILPEHGAGIFRDHCLGVSTNRDKIVYDFSKAALESRIASFIESYNAEVYRWIDQGRPTNVPAKEIDDFVRYDKVKWSEHLKSALKRRQTARFRPSAIRLALWRPFCKRVLYYDGLLNDRPAAFANIFPNGSADNLVLIVSDHGHRAPFSVMISNLTPDLHVLASEDGFQNFPLYTYAEDGSNRRENITDWALGQFRAAYGEDVTREDLFHYVYAILHHPVYRERYAENLKRELPRIPLVEGRAAWETCVRIGRELAQLHLTYEQAPEYPLQLIEAPGQYPDWRVKKMKLTADKFALIYNDWLTLAGIPPECFAYRLGNRSALEWVIDQYQVSTDSRSTITSDPNRPDDPQYIARLVRQVVHVSIETVRLVRELEQSVRLGEEEQQAADVSSMVTPAQAQ